MANILEQSEIDRVSLAKNARDKIINNYLDIIGVPCIYDVFDKKGLIKALEDIMRYGTSTGNRGSSQDVKDFLIQVNTLLFRL